MNIRLLSIIAGLAASSGAAAQTYSITALNPAINGSSYGSGINEAGHVCGQARISNNTYVSALWKPGLPVQGLSTQNGLAGDINNAGQVIGAYYGTAGGFPYVWDSGSLTMLSPSSGHTYADVWQINDSGVIVGAAYEGTSPNWVVDACNWTRSGNQWNVSHFPSLAPGGAAGIYGINNNGVQVGTSQDSTGVFRACKWEGGIATELPAPTPNTYAFATSVNSAGRYIGNTRNGSPLASSAFAFDGAALVPIAGVPGFSSTHVMRINDAGTVIGWCFNGDPIFWLATFIDCRAIVWRSGTTATLNSLIHSAPGPGWDIRQAWDINNRGQISAITCVNGTGPNCTGGLWRAVLLTPCYANCDNSTTAPALTGNDFQCFLDKFVAADSYADCDGVGGLTANDFQCFINAFVAGCP